MSIKKRISLFLILFAFVFTLGGEVILSAFAVRARADSVTYSNVLDDLKKDSSFNPDDYPADDSDHSLQVIHIAESTNNELILYVYQPSGSSSSIVASSVSISKTEGVDFSPHRYTLKLLGSDGVFFKYVVNDFEILNNNVNTYVIPCLYRPFDSDIDEDAPGDNIYNEMYCPVGKTWTISYVNGKTYVDFKYEDYIVVTSKHVGFARYTDSDNFWISQNTDSHYVAFSTDKPIEKLLEVDIEFKWHSYYKHYQKNSITGEERTWIDNENYGEEHKTIYAEEIFEKNNSLWFPDYEYKRIQTVSELLKNEGEEMDSEFKASLSDKKWVVRFFESDYGLVDNSNGAIGLTSYRQNITDVTEVVLLRMEYEFDGEIYNLGVVDNVQSGDSVPDWTVEPDFEGWFEKILLIVGIILLLVVLIFLSTPIKFIFDIVYSGIKFIITLIVNLISFPFKILFRSLKK